MTRQGKCETYRVWLNCGTSSCLRLSIEKGAEFWTLPRRVSCLRENALLTCVTTNALDTKQQVLQLSWLRKLQQRLMHDWANLEVCANTLWLTVFRRRWFNHWLIQPERWKWEASWNKNNDICFDMLRTWIHNKPILVNVATASVYN